MCYYYCSWYCMCSIISIYLLGELYSVNYKKFSNWWRRISWLRFLGTLIPTILGQNLVIVFNRYFFSDNHIKFTRNQLKVKRNGPFSLINEIQQNKSFFSFLILYNFFSYKFLFIFFSLLPFLIFFFNFWPVMSSRYFAPFFSIFLLYLRKNFMFT